MNASRWLTDVWNAYQATRIWKRGMGYAVARPVFGIGLGNFPSAEGRSRVALQQFSQGRGWKWSAPHNSLVQITSELGFIAGSLFIVVIVGSIASLVRTFRETQGQDQLPAFLALSIVGYAVTGFFLTWAFYDLPYVLFGLAAGVLVQYSSGQAAADPTQGSIPTAAAQPRRSPLWSPPSERIPRAPDLRPETVAHAKSS